MQQRPMCKARSSVNSCIFVYTAIEMPFSGLPGQILAFRSVSEHYKAFHYYSSVELLEVIRPISADYIRLAILSVAMNTLVYASRSAET